MFHYKPSSLGIPHFKEPPSKVIWDSYPNCQLTMISPVQRNCARWHSGLLFWLALASDLPCGSLTQQSSFLWWQVKAVHELTPTSHWINILYILYIHVSIFARVGMYILYIIYIYIFVYSSACISFSFFLGMPWHAMACHAWSSSPGKCGLYDALRIFFLLDPSEHGSGLGFL